MRRCGSTWKFNWNKSDGENKHYGITYMRNLEKEKAANFIETDNRMVVVKSWRWQKRGNVGQRIHIFSYTKNNFQGIKYSIVTMLNNMVLNTWKLPREDLKHSHHQKKKKKAKLYEVMYMPIILILVPFHNVYQITMFILKYIHICQLFLNRI